MSHIVLFHNTIQGSTYKAEVQCYYNNHDWLPQFEQFYKTAEGSQFCEGFWQVAESHFPHYMEEIKGIADGSSIDLLKVHTLNNSIT